MYYMPPVHQHYDGDNKAQSSQTSNAIFRLTYAMRASPMVIVVVMLIETDGDWVQPGSNRFCQPGCVSM